MELFKIEWSLSLLNKYAAIILDEDMKQYSLNKTQMLFIIHLKHRSGIHQDQLATMFKTNRSTVTRSVDQLINLGYVSKTIDEHNKKANRLSLTETGFVLYDKVMVSVSDWIDILTKNMSIEEKKMSIKLLTDMAGNACQHLGDERLAHIIKGE